MYDTSSRERGVTMIFHDDDYLSTVVPRFPPLWARITASGEPHRRTWAAEVNWRVRDDLLRGNMKITNKWLSGLLLQRSAIEKNMFVAGTGATGEINMAIAYHKGLHRSLLSTATRYCADLNIGVSSHMRTS